MSDEQRKQAEAIFQQAVDLSAEQCAAFLDAQCGVDLTLRDEVEALLGVSDVALGDFLQAAPSEVEGACAEAGVPAVPERIGRYRILRVIGAGGMGVVYEAAQESPNRKVALKLLQPGWLSASLLKRFEHEAEVLGRLRHPGIAQIYEAGVHRPDIGPPVPFFAMELINGRPLTEYAEHARLGTRQRLELFARVCDAVQDAHQHGVIHRDLKPANILVEDTPPASSTGWAGGSGGAQPKILDFGVARATDGDIALTTMRTGVGQLIGTITHMSPEQARGDSRELDTRSDVYALGVILYELLAGRLPHDVVHKPIAEAVRVITQDDPTPVCSVVDSAGRSLRHLRGDIETIVARAMEKEKGRRYGSAAELAADIRRYLADEPIVARPASMFYQLRKFARRNRGLVGGVVTAFVVLVAGLVVSLTSWRSAVRERERADQEAAQARAAYHTAEQQRRQSEFSAYAANIASADSALRLNAGAEVRTRLNAAPERLRNWEWGHLNARAERSLAVMRGHTGMVCSVAISPDGKRLLTGSTDRTARLWDVDTGAELAVLPGHASTIESAVFSPDGTRILTGSNDNTARLWDAHTGAELAVLRGHAKVVYSVTFSPDGIRALTGSYDATARLWDAHTGAPLALLRGHTDAVSFTAFSPDGTRVLTGSWDGTARLWNTYTGEQETVLRGHTETISSVAFSPDGMLIATGAWDDTGRVWDAHTGAALVILRADMSRIRLVAFSPDGAQLLTGSLDNTARLWEARQGAELAVLHGHTNEIRSMAFSPDGARVLTGASDSTARLWDARTGAELAVLRGHIGDIFSVAFSPDGTRVFTGSHDGTARVWDAFTPVELPVLRGHDGGIFSAAFSPEGTRVLTGSHDRTARIWDAYTGAPLAVLSGHSGDVSSVAFSPDGTRILTGSHDGTARLWDADTGVEMAVLRGHTKGVYSVAFSPDGERVLTGAHDRTARLWDAHTGAELAVLRGHTAEVECVAFSPDGTRVLTGSSDSTARLWDAQSGAELRVLRGHTATVSSVAFSPDRTLVLTGSSDNTARLWDAHTGAELGVLRGHAKTVSSVAFSLDGTRILTGSEDGSARLWDTFAGEEVATLREHAGPVACATFSPDGKRILTGSWDRTARLWDSVPYAQRYPEQKEVGAALDQARTLVDRLQAEFQDWSRIAGAIRADRLLNEVVRLQAFIEVLRRASAERQEGVAVTQPAT